MPLSLPRPSTCRNSSVVVRVNHKFTCSSPCLQKIVNVLAFYSGTLLNRGGLPEREAMIYSLGFGTIRQLYHTIDY